MQDDFVFKFTLDRRFSQECDVSPKSLPVNHCGALGTRHNPLRCALGHAEAPRKGFPEEGKGISNPSCF